MNKETSKIKTAFNILAILIILFIGWITYKYGIMRDATLAKRDTVYTIATVTNIEGSASGGPVANFKVSVYRKKYDGFFVLGKSKNIKVGNRYYYICLTSDIGYGNY